MKCFYQEQEELNTRSRNTMTIITYRSLEEDKKIRRKNDFVELYSLTDHKIVCNCKNNVSIMRTGATVEKQTNRKVSCIQYYSMRNQWFVDNDMRIKANIAVLLHGDQWFVHVDIDV